MLGISKNIDLIWKLIFIPKISLLIFICTSIYAPIWGFRKKTCALKTPTKKKTNEKYQKKLVFIFFQYRFTGVFFENIKKTPTKKHQPKKTPTKKIPIPILILIKNNSFISRKKFLAPEIKLFFWNLIQIFFIHHFL